MAGWDMLFAGSARFAPDPSKGEAWNRGAYLVETLGHCSACHSPRNVLGATEAGKRHLAGGLAEGWHAPALNGTGAGPVGWSETALYRYLRTGSAAGHGSAGGPMAEVIKSLGALPDSDIRAMAKYLASVSSVSETAAADAEKKAVAASAEAAGRAALTSPEGARIFRGACSACHSPQNPIAPLAVNTALHAETADNVVQTILHGAPAPALLAPVGHRAELEVMSMPAFGESLSDRQIEALVTYLRARFAPGAPAFEDIGEAIARARVTVARH